jgi:hypothetical protein
MQNELTTTTDAGTAVSLPAELREQMEAHARNSRTENTWRAYQSDWRVWEAWAAEHGATVLSASPELVAAFLTDMANGYLWKRQARSVIVHGFLVEFDATQLVGLDFATRGDGTGVLEFLDEGAIVRLSKSKTKQASEDEVHIQPGPALKAVRFWIERASIVPGTPLLRGTTRSGGVSPRRLCDKMVARIVKNRCEAMGLDPKLYSGHSLRAGSITSAAEAGLSEWVIRMTSRHSEKSRELAGYIRPVEKRKHALTNAIGL